MLSMDKWNTITIDKLLANGFYLAYNTDSQWQVYTKDNNTYGVNVHLNDETCFVEVFGGDNEFATFRRLRTMAQVNFITNSYLFN